MLPKFSWPRYEANIERFIFVFHVFNRYQKVWDAGYLQILFCVQYVFLYVAMKDWLV